MFARVIAVLVVCALPCACTTWRLTSLEPAQFSAQKSPALVRLTLADSTRLNARHPVIVGDSLVWTDMWSAARQAVPVNGIQRAEVQHTDAGGTFVILGLVAGLVAAALSFLSAVSKG